MDSSTVLVVERCLSFQFLFTYRALELLFTKRKADQRLVVFGKNQNITSCRVPNTTDVVRKQTKTACWIVYTNNSNRSFYY